MSEEYSKGRRVVMFSDARIAFEKEIRDNHPKLAMKILLASKESGVFEDDEMDGGIAIGTVAAEFNIAMEGWYEPEQIEFMYSELWHKLRASDSPIGDLVLPAGDLLQ